MRHISDLRPHDYDLWSFDLQGSSKSKQYQIIKISY